MQETYARASFLQVHKKKTTGTKYNKILNTNAKEKY